MNVRFISHKDEALQALDEAIAQALEMIGSKAAGYVSGLAPADTGRLRNSYTWATKRSEGRGFSYTDDNNNVFSYDIGTGVPDDTVCIGTNVEYAVYQELGTSLIDAQPHLRPGVEDHLDEYKEIARRCLKGQA